jgi:hypothetical protein
MASKCRSSNSMASSFRGYITDSFRSDSLGGSEKRFWKDTGEKVRPGSTPPCHPLPPSRLQVCAASLSSCSRPWRLVGVQHLPSTRSSVPRPHCQLRPSLWPLLLVSTICIAPCCFPVPVHVCSCHSLLTGMGWHLTADNLEPFGIRLCFSGWVIFSGFT